MALVEKYSSSMLKDISKMDNSITNFVNGNNISNGNNGTDKYEIRWKGYEGNLIRTVEDLQLNTSLTDVTVACEDGFKASLHKLILATSSTYFRQIFENFHESKHPIIILSGIRGDILKFIVSFLYSGLVEVPVAQIELLISAGKSLKIKGLMDMQDDSLNKPMDLSATSKLQPHNTDSFMMSPTSEPDTTAKQLAKEPKQTNQEDKLVMPVSTESNSEPPKEAENRSASFAWPKCDMLLLLAEAAEMKEKMERAERFSSNDDSDDHSPLVIDEDAVSEDESKGIVASNGKKRKHDSSEESASDESRLRFDKEQLATQNLPKQGKSSTLLAAVPANQPIPSATPHQLGFTNPNTLWPTRDLTTEFYQILPSNVALSNQLASSLTSTTTVRINSDFSIPRLTAGSSHLVPRSSSARQNSRIPSRIDPVVGLVRPTATRPIVSVVPGHALGEHQYTRTSHWTPAVAQARTEVTSHRSSGARRSLPSTSSTRNATSLQPSRRSTSPINATAAGANWKSRQPTQCEFCNRMFSNKFNLKQHVTNMHSTGEGVKCDECGKMVKNKWYMRRHNVTHHGAPLRKAKKRDDSNHEG